MVVTERSNNRKTGNMEQISYLHASIEPHKAAQCGADRAVCGNCPQRPSNGGACYVVTCQGPLAQYRARTEPLKPAARPVRYGMYGDPGSVPRSTFEAWHRAREVAKWTGYTHQWRRRQWLAQYVMASCDSEREAQEAQSRGWRTFRIRASADDPLLPGEIQCPAEKSDGAVQCVDCLLCCGNARKGPNVAIVAHGGRARKLQHRK